MDHEPNDSPAYVISEVEVLHEPDADRYRAPTVLEGDWPAARRAVVVEFPSARRAREWYASREYAEALDIRTTALDRRLVLVEGVQQ